MTIWKTYIVLLILLSALAAGCSPANKQPAVNTAQPVAIGVQPGQKAPDFSLLNEHDVMTSLSQFQGKVVVINFWATWCGPCRDEMPALQRFNREIDANVILLGINVKEDKDTIAKFMQQGGYTYPVVRDTFAQTANQYQVRAIPATYVIDKQGIIRFKKVGPVTTEELKQYVDAVQN